jgi:hypothetical protein
MNVVNMKHDDNARAVAEGMQNLYYALTTGPMAFRGEDALELVKSFYQSGIE